MDIELGKSVASLDEKDASNDATFDYVMHFVVPISQKEYFEKVWMSQLYNTVNTFKGFVARHLHIIGLKAQFIEYISVMMWRTLEEAKVWSESEERKKLYSLLSEKEIAPRLLNVYGGENKNLFTIDKDNNVIDSRIIIQDGLAALPKVVAPAKWKLVIILICGVYSSLLLLRYGGFAARLTDLHYPPATITFFGVCIVVFVMMFGFLPLVMSVPLIQTWLRAPRKPVTEMHPLEEVLDQGLAIFASSVNAPKLPAEIVQRLNTLEVKVEKLRDVNHALRSELVDIINQLGSNDGKRRHIFEINQGDSNTATEQNDLLKSSAAYLRFLKRVGVSDDTEVNNSIDSHDINFENDNHIGKLTMAVRHYVKWEYEPEFEKWTDAMVEEMSKHEGFMGMVRIAPKSDGDPFINSFTFDSFENLMAFTRSEKRLSLIEQLAPMLAGTSSFELSEERAIGDAFSELFVSTGGAASTRPPPVWKAAILTVISLFLVVYQVGGNLFNYISADCKNFYVVQLFIVLINVFVNSYLGQPLMFMLFGAWLNMSRVRHPREYHLPGVGYLDKGFPMFGQCCIVLIYLILNVVYGKNEYFGHDFSCH